MSSSENKDLVQFLNEFHSKSGIRIRPGVKSDCLEVARLVQELADFEKMPDGPKINFNVLEHDGFELGSPLFKLFVAEEPKSEKSDGNPSLIGYALYYYKYSTWVGKAMLLEDLYCTPEFRSSGVGSALFRAVAKESVFTGCQRMDFEVLSWNPARKFYERHGAKNITESEQWLFYRLHKQEMEAL